VHYLWKYDNGITDTLAQPTPTFTDTGYHTVKLIVTGKQGCKDSVTRQKAIYVAPVPVAGFTYKLQQVCGGIQCSVTNTSKHASKYIWDFLG
jgi:PKD repeat protein